MVYSYYTYRGAQDFIADINSYYKRNGWSDTFNIGLRIKLEDDGRFKVSKGFLYGFSIYYWFEGNIIDKNRYTEVTFSFRWPFVKVLLGFILLLPTIELSVLIYTHQWQECFTVLLAASLMILINGSMIYWDKMRIKKEFIETFELIEGPF